MAEVLIAQAVAFAVAGTTTTLVGRAGPYNPDFPPGEIFVVLFLAGLILFAGLTAGSSPEPPSEPGGRTA